MEKSQSRVIPVEIEDEVKQSYLKYAMSVIVARALPDARDGLKPVHRRILFGMNEMGLHPDRPPKKCARIVGDVLGKFHPHGDMSVYDALVRMAQDFSLRYPLINGQGNFGSVDGDPPAAMRYTEARLTTLAEEMLQDIKKETVDFVPNYDDSMDEPSVLPASFPCLLANGSSGIAVGMATNIPPHNLKEISRAVSAYIENPEISIDGLMKYITGPDFPTGCTIFGKKGIQQAYQTGRGKITLQSKFSLEQTKTGRDIIIIHEIPYQVNKANLIIKIADQIRDKKIDGISDLRDESDRNGLRIVIELKRGVTTKIILNQLFSQTQLQTNFNVNSLALVKGKPKLLSLKEMIQAFIEHRQEIVTRRTQFDLKKAEDRAHILEGLKIALSNIDAIIKTIKESKNVDDGRRRLMKTFSLTAIQAQAILDMRLQKLTNLETQKILEELESITKLIKKLKEILSSTKNILAIVDKECSEMATRFGQERRTSLVKEEIEEIDVEDLIEKEDMVIIASKKGYIKRVPVSSYRVQGRGGKGVTTSNLRDEDFIQNIFVASTHDFVLIITSKAKAYSLKVHNIPEGSRISRGSHIRSLLGFSQDEDIAAMVPVQEFDNEKFIFLSTRLGMVKKMATSSFSNAKGRGIIAMGLHDNDSIVSAILTSDEQDMLIATRMGLGLRFQTASVRPVGRTAQGVRGIKLGHNDEVAGVIEINNKQNVLLVTQYGLGKRMRNSELSPHGRNTKGQKIYNTSDKTGELVNILTVSKNDEIVAITNSGNSIKLKASSVALQGRTAQGIRIFDIQKPNFVVGVDKIVPLH